VFIYFGSLAPVFAGVARVLRPGGTFCFTVEAAHEAEGGAGHAVGDMAGGNGQGEPRIDWVLRPSMRYAHRESYIRRLADHHGFVVTDTVRRPVREDQRTPVPGLFFWLAQC
jgi:predicted TPR repeat methyltransferase